MQTTTERAHLVLPALTTKPVAKTVQTDENAMAVVVEDHAAAVDLVAGVALGLATVLDHTMDSALTMALTMAVTAEGGAHGDTGVHMEAVPLEAVPLVLEAILSTHPPLSLTSSISSTTQVLRTMTLGIRPDHLETKITLLKPTFLTLSQHTWFTSPFLALRRKMSV